MARVTPGRQLRVCARHDDGGCVCAQGMAMAACVLAACKALRWLGVCTEGRTMPCKALRWLESHPLEGSCVRACVRARVLACARARVSACVRACVRAGERRVWRACVFEWGLAWAAVLVPACAFVLCVR